MINAQLLREEGLLIVSPVHKLEATDFDRLRLLVDPYIEAHGEIKGLLIDAESFPGWEDFSGLLEHLRFVRDYQQRIRQVACGNRQRLSRDTAEGRGLLRGCQGTPFRLPGSRQGIELAAHGQKSPLR